MAQLSDLFDNNRRWAARMTRTQPDFFARLVGQQAPRYLWIGRSRRQCHPAHGRLPNRHQAIAGAHEQGQPTTAQGAADVELHTRS